MRRPLLLLAVGAAGMIAGSGVAVAAVQGVPGLELPAAGQAPEPAPSTAATAPTSMSAANPHNDLEAALADLQESADQVNHDVGVLLADLDAWTQDRGAEGSGLGETRVGPTDVSRLLGIDNRIVWFDGIAATPCPPFVLSSYGAYHCGIDDTIYIGSWVDTLTPGQRIFVYAHEDGHSELHEAYSTVTEEEAYADAFGGRRMAQLRAAGLVSDRDVADARALLAGIGDSDHGTGDERVAAFDRGYRSA